jgi:hypothetical protein
VDLVGRGEVDAVDLVDHVAEEVAAGHAVDDAGEDGRDDQPAAPGPVAAVKGAEVGEQAAALRAVGAGAFLVVDERQQLRPGDAVLLGGPVAPAVRRLDRRPHAFLAELGPRGLDLLHVVEELEEHDPGEHRQPVEVAGGPPRFTNVKNDGEPAWRRSRTLADCWRQVNITCMDSDFASAAARHLRDAEHLSGTERWDNAAYLAGYVGECSLKAVIERAGCVPPRVHLDEIDEQHVLLVADLSYAARRYPVDLDADLAALRTAWRPGLRYSTTGTIQQPQAQRMLAEARRAYVQTIGNMVLDGLYEGVPQ